MRISDYTEIVRQELKKHLGHPMPKGIYAGGALSSIVLEKIWGKEILSGDRFELYRDYPDRVGDDSEFVIRFTGTGPYKAESEIKEGYTVLSSHQEGKVIIKVCHKIGMVLGAEGRAIQICRGLSLNALQVAYVTYETGMGSLYATDHFIQFAKSRQLRITCNVFGRTIIDLAKYQELYNAYVDWDEEALMMAGLRDACTAANSKVYDDLLSSEDKQLFDRHKEKLVNYCTITELTEPALPGLEKLMQSSWKIDFYHAARNPEIQSTIHQALINSGYSLTNFTYSQIFEVLIRKSTRMAIKRRFWTAMKSPEASYFVMNDAKYLSNDFASKHLLEIAKFNSCHPSAMKIISGLHNDFVSQVKTIRLLKKLGRVHGNPDFVIGLVETARHYGIQLKEISEQSINKLVAAYASIGSSMIEPADLSQFKYKESLVELTSGAALLLEGIRNSNCIGGFHGEVVESAGNVRIFHINTPGSNQHGTSVIYNNETDDLDFDYEVYGPGNSDASEEHDLITIELAYFLRDTIWKPKTPEDDQAIDCSSVD
jgi:hypothetical protein